MEKSSEVFFADRVSKHEYHLGEFIIGNGSSATRAAAVARSHKPRYNDVTIAAEPAKRPASAFSKKFLNDAHKNKLHKPVRTTLDDASLATSSTLNDFNCKAFIWPVAPAKKSKAKISFCDKLNS